MKLLVEEFAWQFHEQSDGGGVLQVQPMGDHGIPDGPVMFFTFGAEQRSKLASKTATVRIAPASAMPSGIVGKRR